MLKPLNRRQWIARTGLIAGAMMVSPLGACQMFEEKEQIHDFVFDTPRDSPNIELLDWGHKNLKYTVSATSKTFEKIREDNGRLPTQAVDENIAYRGVSMYARWRDKITGQVHENHVDLAERLPRDVSGMKVYMLIDDNQLFVYLIPRTVEFSLITMEVESTRKYYLPEGKPPNGPRYYAEMDNTTIYPDNSPRKLRGGE